MKHKIPVEHLIELKSLVEYTFGHKVLNLNDCINLSSSIFLKVKSSVSSDTLRRLFGLIETKSQPSLYTLETLAKYAGFSGYNDFTNSTVLVGKHFFYKQILDCNANKLMPFEALESMQNINPSADYYSTLHQLIILAFQKKDKLFFENLFINQLGFDWLSIYKYEIYQTVQLLGKLVEDNDWLQDIALKNYVALPFYFDYFVEWYVADEQPYYLILLERYKEAHYNNPEKLIFYNSIKAICSFRSNEFDKFYVYNETLTLLENQCSPNNILKARILGVNYLNGVIKKDAQAEQNILTTDFEKLFPDIGDRVTSMFFLFNYLFEVKAYPLIIELFERWLSHDAAFFSIWTRINWNQICLYLVYSYQNANKKEVAISFYNQIKPSLFEVYNYKRFQKLYEELKLEY